MKLLTIILACLACINLEAELFFTPQMVAKHLETYSDNEIALIEKDLKKLIINGEVVLITLF